MKVTHVSIRASEAAQNLGRPELTPELLAASGARYSRNNEGLEAILSKIDPNNLDKSVDSIFRMIDYGHQSIADMAPVAIFMDGLSHALAYYVWSLTPTAGGQESSTRYLNYSTDSLLAPEKLGIPKDLVGEWQDNMGQAVNLYEESLKIWCEIAAEQPEVMGIPKSLIEDPSDKAKKKVKRLQRNYGFDRARYFLPLAVPTNVMLIMSARGWVSLCQRLLSHPSPEFRELGTCIRSELDLVTPRLTKHAREVESMKEGWQVEFRRSQAIVKGEEQSPLSPNSSNCIRKDEAFLDVWADHHSEEEFQEDLSWHDNRYSWVGSSLQRTPVRFAWNGVTMAELRDLNRHRTGSKYTPLVPQGFYYAEDNIPDTIRNKEEVRSTLQKFAGHGSRLSLQGRERLLAGEHSYLFWTLFGTQYAFEHVTTADKFLYEAELRTGPGAHYRYALHLREALNLWYKRFPKTKELILEGSSEPE